MKIRTRLFCTMVIVISLLLYFFYDFISEDISTSYLEMAEETLNDTAHILATLVETEIQKGKINPNHLKLILNRSFKKRINAQIYKLHKKRVSLHVYIVNKMGVVIYDSNKGKAEGKNYYKWNDVRLTLRNKYGARSSYFENNPKAGKAIYIAAPIKYKSRIIGALTVVKRKKVIRILQKAAKLKVIEAAAITLLTLIILSIAISIWITRPLIRLTQYVEQLPFTKNLKLPPLGNSEINDLGISFEKMREKLEGKKYIEQYVQNLTHELKSPLSSIIGAAEIVAENVPPATQKKFISNIITESKRIENLVERLLQLSALENRRQKPIKEKIPLCRLFDEIHESVLPAITKKKIAFKIWLSEEIIIYGEYFLIKQALDNLVQNALRFTPNNGTITISAIYDNDSITIAVSDTGKGIPSFAIDRVFEKFYSIADSTGKKSTGLGLPFVAQVAQFHNGFASIQNNKQYGVTAQIHLPLG